MATMIIAATSQGLLSPGAPQPGRYMHVVRRRITGPPDALGHSVAGNRTRNRVVSRAQRLLQLHKRFAHCRERMQVVLQNESNGAGTPHLASAGSVAGQAPGSSPFSTSAGPRPQTRSEASSPT